MRCKRCGSRDVEWFCSILFCEPYTHTEIWCNDCGAKITSDMCIDMPAMWDLMFEPEPLSNPE
jgi:hypothetical protein